MWVAGVQLRGLGGGQELGSRPGRPLSESGGGESYGARGTPELEQDDLRRGVEAAQDEGVRYQPGVRRQLLPGRAQQLQ